MFPFQPILLRLFYEQALPPRSPLMYLLAAQQFSANVNFKDDTANKWLLALDRCQSQRGSINNQWQPEGFHPSSHNSCAAFYYQTKWKSRLRQRAASAVAASAARTENNEEQILSFQMTWLRSLGFTDTTYWVVFIPWNYPFENKFSLFIIIRYRHFRRSRWKSVKGLHRTTLISSSWNLYCRLMAAHKHLSKESNLLFSTFFVWDKHTYMLITSRRRHIFAQTTSSAREQSQLSSWNCGGALA